MIIYKIISSVDYNQRFERMDTQFNKPTNQVPKVVKPERLRKYYFKIQKSPFPNIKLILFVNYFDIRYIVAP